MSPAPDVGKRPRLRVLILEDSPADAQLVARALITAGFDLDVDEAAERGRFEELLAGEAHDVILADYTLPGFDARAALALAQAACPTTPFICVSGTIGEEATVELLKAGADDCVLKDRLSRLPFAVERALEAKRMEANAAEASARARLLVDLIEHSDQPLQVSYPDGRTAFVNAALCRLTGYSTEEMLRLTWTEDLTPAEWLPVERRVAAELARGGPSRRFETEYLCKDGGRVPVELLSHMARDEQGEPEYYYSFVTDLRERKAAEAALRESERRFRSLFEDSPVALWEEDHAAVKPHLEQLVAAGVGDVAGYLREHPAEYQRCLGLVRILHANHAAAALFEAASGEELIAHHDEVFPPGDIAGLPLFWAAVLAGKRSATYEETNITLAGRELQLLETCMAAPGHEALLDRVYIVDVDITERKQAEEANARLAAIVASSEDAIFSLTLEDTILTWNPGAERLFGYAATEVVGGSVRRLVPPGSEDEHALFMERIGRGVTVEHYETSRVRRDGAEVEVSLSLSPLKDAAGIIVGVAEIARDVTERRFRERESGWTAQLVSLVDATRGFRELVADLTAVLQRETRCEAVGIRLRAGDDYPYYEARGFPPEHVAAEDHLCAHGSDGQILRDEVGNPVLECVCGNILCGRFDPAKPFFSARGSFWTNSTTALLVSATEAERQARTCDRCNGEGYESVALVPLRSGDQVFGLLQFNDHRPDRFTEDMIVHLERMADALAVALSRREAAEEVRRHTEQLRRTVEGAVLAMSHLVESRDPYTAGHERRVAELAVALAAELGLPDEELESLRLASTIHDVGKIAVPAEILSKPGRLNAVEFELVKQHSQVGFDILADAGFGHPAAEMVLQHHERLDGSGYPAGLQGDAILPEARILAVADVVEAMSSHRPYRASLGMDAALAELREHAGAKYDADVVAACVRLIEEQGFQFTP